MPYLLLDHRIPKSFCPIAQSVDPISFGLFPEAEKEKLVSSVEKETLGILAKYRNYKYIRIYFLGDGTTGIDKPYICQITFKACIKTKQQGEP